MPARPDDGSTGGAGTGPGGGAGTGTGGGGAGSGPRTSTPTPGSAWARNVELSGRKPPPRPVRVAGVSTHPTPLTVSQRLTNYARQNETLWTRRITRRQARRLMHKQHRAAQA